MVYDRIFINMFLNKNRSWVQFNEQKTKRHEISKRYLELKIWPPQKTVVCRMCKALTHPKPLKILNWSNRLSKNELLKCKNQKQHGDTTEGHSGYLIILYPVHEPHKTSFPMYKDLSNYLRCIWDFILHALYYCTERSSTTVYVWNCTHN